MLHHSPVLWYTSIIPALRRIQGQPELQWDLVSKKKKKKVALPLLRLWLFPTHAAGAHDALGSKLPRCSRGCAPGDCQCASLLHSVLDMIKCRVQQELGQDGRVSLTSHSVGGHIAIPPPRGTRRDGWFHLKPSLCRRKKKCHFSQETDTLICIGSGRKPASFYKWTVDAVALKVTHSYQSFTASMSKCGIPHGQEPCRNFIFMCDYSGPLRIARRQREPNHGWKDMEVN
jgi:hypothetical protein